MGEIIWKCVCVCVCVGGTGEGGDGAGVCVCAGWGWGLEGVQGVHEASLPYQRHSRLSVLMVIALPTIGAHSSDHNNKKKISKNGWREEEEGY